MQALTSWRRLMPTIVTDWQTATHPARRIGLDSTRLEYTPPSISLLYSIINKQFKHVKLPLPKDWGLCGTCEQHKAEAFRGYSCNNIKALALARHAKHEELHRTERADFVDRCSTAEHNPSRAALFHIDYSRSVPDPSFSPTPSPLRRLTPMQFMIGACMSMSTSESYIFSHTQGIPKGGSLICTILYHCIRTLYSSGGIA